MKSWGVWQHGMELVREVYVVTRHFPREEQFGLTSQLRRAAVSIPANLAEGYGRGSKPAFAQFARISQGSLFEVRTLLEIAVTTQTAQEDQIAPLLERAVTLSRMLDGFVRSLGNSETATS
ncbi:four helix bundle protein [bacterium]|nr:MAG: four helix bundle protein [bacterium]